jgi:outer membrane lipoprotein LolB
VIRVSRAAGLLLCVLGACAHVPPPLEKPEAKNAISLSGRVSVHQEEKNFSGQFQWVSSNGRDEILLTDPLGQGVARVVRDEKEATLQLPDGRQQTAPDADTLTEKVLGFRLPLAGMGYWITARADPLKPSQLARNDSGQVTSISQEGWKIDYLSYADDRPKKLLITRETLEIKLIVDHWEP